MRRPLRLLGAAVAVVVIGVKLVGLGGESIPVAPPIIVNHAYVESADTLKRNETLSELFARHNIGPNDLVRVLDAASDLNPRRMRAGQVFQFRYAVNDDLPSRVTVRLGDERVLTLSRDSNRAWMGESREIPWTVDTRRVEGEIGSSLYETIDALIPDSILNGGERARLVWDLADGVFGWVVDFTRDNYPGDRVAILYERLISGLGDVRFGRILAARVETRGSENRAYVMTDAAGRNQYYDASGNSLKRAFRLYPAEFRRISGGFNPSRFHPILQRSRPHLGVDYAAASGTPVKVTGDGTVIRAGRWGGYGIMVAVRHAKGIETRYAHMRGLAAGIHAGVRVQQGQTIGYVGMTGLATGPHVHYEFIKNGQHVDPRIAVRYGSSMPVPADRRAEFEQARDRFDRLLETHRWSTIAAGSH